MKFQFMETTRSKGLESYHGIQFTRSEGRVLVLKLATGPYPATDLSSQSQLSMTARCLASQSAVRVTLTKMKINLEGEILARNSGQVFYLAKVTILQCALKTHSKAKLTF